MKQPKSRLLALIYDHRYGLGLILIAVLAIYYRVYLLVSLPPGLHIDEATYGIKAMNVLHKAGALPVADTQTASQPFLYLTALMVRLFGNTVLALRILPVFFGVAGVAMTWWWAKEWFGNRTAFLAAFILAVLPWAVTFSRIGIEASSAVFVVSASAAILTLAVRKDTIVWYLLAGLALAILLWIYPSLWAALIGLAVIGGVQASKLGERFNASLPKIGALILCFAVITGAIIFFDKQHSITSTVSHQFAALKPSAQLAQNASQTLVMFNTRGDNDARHNIAGWAELNLFVGLMFLLGLLVCALHFRKWSYFNLLILVVFLLLPGLGSATAPDSRLVLGVVPVAVILAAIGIDYMLETWYKTFPVNSAARGLGTLPIIILLALTAYQGYQQYFIAWGHSPEAFEAYNERAAAIAQFMNRNTYDHDRYGVLDTYDNLVVGYLTFGKAKYNRLGPDDTSVLPKDAGPKQFIITKGLSDNYLKALKKAYPKATLSQHYSEYNDNNELFAVYEVKGE